MNFPNKLITHQLNRPDIDTYHQLVKNPIIVLLDNVRSMHNVGSVFRTSDAFAIEQIVLAGITPTPPHRDIYKTALGSEQSVSWIHTNDVIEYLNLKKKEDYTIIGIEQTDKSISIKDFGKEIVKSKKYIIVLGNEIDGVQQDILNLCDVILEIPQYGTKHSLNISVAAGIVLWELSKDIQD